MPSNDELDLIAKLAAEHCMLIATLTATEEEGKPTAALEEEAKHAYAALLAALDRAGYLAPYMTGLHESGQPPTGSKH